MGDYNAPRKGNAYNYGGGQWKLSRSKIAAFMKCPKCFWIDNVGGIKHPGGFPFKLNEAVDLILKRESDHIRQTGDNHEPDLVGSDLGELRDEALSFTLACRFGGRTLTVFNMYTPKPK